MKKSISKQLVKGSYTNGQLDEQKVQRIANILKRSELKSYVKELRLEEQKKHVIITSASTLSAQDGETLRKLFPQKEVIFQIDQTLISGIRVMNNDVTYESNVSQLLNDVALFLSNL